MRETVQGDRGLATTGTAKNQQGLLGVVGQGFVLLFVEERRNDRHFFTTLAGANDALCESTAFPSRKRGAHSVVVPGPVAGTVAAKGLIGRLNLHQLAVVERQDAALGQGALDRAVRCFLFVVLALGVVKEDLGDRSLAPINHVDLVL